MSPQQFVAIHDTAVFVVGMMLVIYGLAQCFWGYRLFRILTVMWSIILLGAVGLTAGYVWSGGHWLAMLAGLAVGGALGFGLGVALYYVVVFLFGTSVGFFAGAAMALALAHGQPGQLAGGSVLPLACALGGGVLAVFMRRPILIILTSLNGAILVCQVGLFLASSRLYGELFESNDLSHWHQHPALAIGMALATLALWFVGMYLQFTAPVEDKQKKPDDAKPPAPAA